MCEADQTVVALTRRRPIEGAVARAHILSAQNRFDDVARAVGRLLAEAPPGFAAWTLPIDPLFWPLHGDRLFVTVLKRLAERAR